MGLRFLHVRRAVLAKATHSLHCGSTSIIFRILQGHPPQPGCRSPNIWQHYYLIALVRYTPNSILHPAAEYLGAHPESPEPRTPFAAEPHIQICRKSCTFVDRQTRKPFNTPPPPRPPGPLTTTPIPPGPFPVLPTPCPNKARHPRETQGSKDFGGFAES